MLFVLATVGWLVGIERELKVEVVARRKAFTPASLSGGCQTGFAAKKALL
ncbi:MAG: hypothetical protein V3T58_00080 [Candidatus Hydrothermarchaeales archaeon]